MRFYSTDDDFSSSESNKNWVFAVTTKEEKEARTHDCVGENIPHAFETIASAHRNRLLFSSPFGPLTHT
jgi:hypothetical protein